MKLSSTLIALALAYGASAHTIFQKISINGADQGQLKGVRATGSNNPIQNVNDPELACNKGLTYKDNVIHNVPAGARIGAWWGHVIGGPQGPNDPDHPIAASHHGPAIAYLAKVDNAATTGTTGLKWFKIAEDGLNGGVWGVDKMIQNGGWQYFDIPQCVAPGNYLLRAELIALHSAYSAGEAQFYTGCAQINITGGGSSTGTNLVTFPGAYSASDPGILRNIYGSGGVANNNGQPYPIPGPPVLNCAGQPQNPVTTTTQQQVTTTSTTGNQPTTTSGGGSGAPLYGQCGGQGWSGPTTCAQGKCTVSNQWYSQCLP